MRRDSHSNVPGDAERSSGQAVEAGTTHDYISQGPPRLYVTSSPGLHFLEPSPPRGYHGPPFVLWLNLWCPG